jgi:hypothetical protein
MWQAYYVEVTIVGVALAVFTLRGLRVALGTFPWGRENAISYFVGEHVFHGLSTHALHNWLWAAATFKIAISMLWFMVIAANITMGVAWHRFTAPFNIAFKRFPEGVALGPLRPMDVNFEDPQDDDVYGAGKVEDLTWKQLLDLPTCTECGRCQSQCPAWNTGKPLSRPRRRSGRWWGRSSRAASSTRTCSGRAPPAAPASSSARSTSSTSTRSSTCAATRC